ncbi:MAG: response regulator [Lachnospiraceae bacterium]|nr:response regulator [Lachnospiraceae bacterium]
MIRNSRKSLILTLAVTFVLMSLLVIFTTRVIYRSSFSYVHEMGDDKTAAITADLENYLENAKSVLWVAADTVDHMVQNGASYEEIKEYITRESSNSEAQFDESYTGIYGVIRGEYVDGVGWVPPEDYDPISRDWYQTTVAGKGEVVIVSPYVDAQTGKVIISIGKSLSDNRNALALDLTLSGVQETTENISINGCGYGFVLNNDGMVIAHHDEEENGKNYRDLKEWNKLYEKAMAKGKGNFEMVIGGKKCTVFVDEVMEQWHLVIITKSSELLAAPMYILFVSILVNVIAFILISVFYILGFRHERKVNQRLEIMKESEQKREYEARLLKLEKSAADSANKAKSDFLADMSHEIRTPINAVLGMNEMIIRESKDENVLDYASNIKKAGDTLLSIINTILDFSKIEDGRMSLVPVEFSVPDLLDGLVNSISERAKGKGLDFEVKVDEDIPVKLFGDDVRISQVIMNLLTNAVKYTEKGSVILRVTKKERTDEKVTLLVEVEDTGIGIKEEDLDKLSVSFERIEEKRNRHIEGTGLGISIVTKLLAMMDSEMKVKSVYGEGSLFYFELGLKIADPMPIGPYEERRKNVSVKKEEKIRLMAEGARVLVTDDNEMNRKVAINLLKLFGIKPDVCASGMETLERMRKEKYDLLFLDHMMPGMDGIETLKMLKYEKTLGDAPVIVLTANAVVGAKEQYLKQGFDGYLSKPIRIEELEEILKTYLPEELITEGSTEDAPAEKPKGLDYFRSLGLDVDEGVSYAAGDEDFYLEMLKEYARSADGKCDELEGYYNNEDWKNYKIQIHAIKSTSKTIGAEKLSDAAKALESASGNSDLDFMKKHHHEFLAEFKKLSGQILDYGKS